MIIGFQPELKNTLLQYFCWNGKTNVEDSHSIIIPENIYVGLLVTTGSQEPVELVVGNKGYERTKVTFTDPAAGYIRNNNRVTFPMATGPWTLSGEKITHIGLFDNDGYDPATGEPVMDQTQGLIVLQSLAAGEVVEAGQTFELDINCIKINLV